MSITHAKASGLPADSGDPTVVNPSDWYAAHVIANGSITAVMLANTTVTPGSYTNCNLTLDAQGRVTAASNGAGGSGITNSAGANVLMKSDGTNAVASGLSDDGTSLISTRKIQIGATAVPLHNFGWFQQQAADTTTQYWFQEDDTGHTGTAGNNEAINIVLRNYTGFAMGTGGVANGSCLDIDVNVSKTSGTGTLTSRGITVLARGADQNYAIDASAGIIRVVDGITSGPISVTGDITTTGSATFTGSLLAGTTLQCSGAATLGTSGTGSTSAVNGNLAIRSSANDTWLEIKNNSTGGRDWFIEASGTSGTDPNCIAIYDQTAAATRFKVDASGLCTANVGILGAYTAAKTESLTASGAASIALGNTFVSGAASNLTLANGTTDGQKKTFIATSGTGQVTPTNFGNGTKMTWSATGQSCTMVWGATSGKWWLTANVGMTVV